MCRLTALVFSLFASLVIMPSANAASDAECQVKLLKVATDALVREFSQKGAAVGVINEIVYNLNLPGIPRVIFLSRTARDPDEVCFIDVRTTIPVEPVNGCPDFKFSEIRTTCK